MPRYRLTIAYDGSDFCGWQKQEPPLATTTPVDAPAPPPLGETPPWFLPQREGRSTLRTVQAVVEHAVRLVVREPVILMGASRTDAGVHARGQVGAFTCSDGSDPEARRGGWPLERGVDRLVLAVNSRLPDDVLVTDAAIAPDDFDPINHARAKAYSYTIHTSRTRPLFDRARVFHFGRPLDARRMHDAAQVLVGEHDFAGFAAANHGRLTTVRTVLACSVIDTDADRVRIDIAGTGFLYNMVRIIAGTLMDVGTGKRPPESVAGALESRNRLNAGPTAPPEGLCLEWIRYDGEAPGASR